ncbi:MAG TPA: hypothetical protein PKH43_02235 [Saprospiraceae bacterium]|nr:hypothetical protein [Saprospiraceae bacterium]
MNWQVRTKDGLVLNYGTVDCVKGFNSFTFALDIREEALKKYQKFLETNRKDDVKPVDISKADTGKYYLQKGGYILELEKSNFRTDKEFVIE